MWMNIYLIRHGETDQNKKRCLQGRSDIELNEYGCELARKTAQALKDVRFDLIFTSPLKRARKTAEILRGERNIPIIEEKRLIEISFGEYEGLCYGKEHYSIPDQNFIFFFEKPECYKVPPKGESFESVIKRTGEFLQKLVQDPVYQDKNILLSTHGCALKAVLAGVRGTPLSDFWGKGVHKNCAVTLLEAKDGRIRVVEEGRIWYN